MRRTVHCAKELQQLTCKNRKGAEEFKRDWKPYVVEQNADLGRYLVAARNLKEGETIFKEDAALVGPEIKTTPLCTNCYKSLLTLPKIFNCQKCEVAPLCSKNCLGIGHSNEECDFFLMKRKENILSMKTMLENPQILIHLRCLVMRQYFPDQWIKFMQMESHMEKRKNTSIWNAHRISVENVLQELGLLSDEDMKHELVQRICGVLDVNSFELRLNGGINGGPGHHIFSGEGVLRGIFLEASLMAHDCVSNTHLSVDNHFKLTIHAATSILKGEIIYFNYTNSLLGTQERQTHLQKGKYFTCMCKRCSDCTELGTYLSAVKCFECKIGYLLPVKPLAQNNYLPDSLWKCQQCSIEHHGNEINVVLQDARKLINENEEKATLRDGENILKKLQMILHPQHFLILELKQNLIGLCSKEISLNSKPRRNLLKLKYELCQDILKVLEDVEPNISRLKGIILYEMHVPKVVLANREYESKEINASQLLEKLLQSEMLLKQAIKILLYEPNDSPEGKLTAQALSEMRLLRDTISGVQNIAEVQMKNENYSFKKK